MDPFMKKVADNAKDVNGPTHFVIVSHTSYSNFGLLPYNKPGAFPCFMLPPLVYSHADAYNKSYFSTMNDSAAFLQYLSNSTVNVTIPMAVSATLKGRWFTAAAQDARSPTIFGACDSFANVEDKPTYSLCESPGQYKHTSTQQIIYITNKDKVFSFDTENTLRYKLCDLKAGLTNIQFGLGVYDIDADADMTPCSDGNYTGRYNRLMLLRKLNDFMKSFTSLADCRNIK
ncbi:hypothetical protein MTO96_047153 [Rhipicephalus appendiculatus]